MGPSLQGYRSRKPKSQCIMVLFCVFDIECKLSEEMLVAKVCIHDEMDPMIHGTPNLDLYCTIKWSCILYVWCHI